MDFNLYLIFFFMVFIIVLDLNNLILLYKVVGFFLSATKDLANRFTDMVLPLK